MVESRVQRAAHLLDRGQQLRQAFEGEEFALQRHDDRVGGGERVDGQQIERRRAVDQDIGDGAGLVGARLAKGLERVAQLVGAVARRRRFPVRRRADPWSRAR